MIFNKRFFLIIGFIISTLFSSIKLKEASANLNKIDNTKRVNTQVIELPPCGRSNIITVSYKKKNYDISVNKNDCIQGKYKIGDTVNVLYDPDSDKMNPLKPIGAYRLTFLLFLIPLLFLFLIFRSKTKSKRKRR